MISQNLSGQRTFLTSSSTVARRLLASSPLIWLLLLLSPIARPLPSLLLWLLFGVHTRKVSVPLICFQSVGLSRRRRILTQDVNGNMVCLLLIRKTWKTSSCTTVYVELVSCHSLNRRNTLSNTALLPLSKPTGRFVLVSLSLGEGECHKPLSGFTRWANVNGGSWTWTRMADLPRQI